MPKFVLTPSQTTYHFGTPQPQTDAQETAMKDKIAAHCDGCSFEPHCTGWCPPVRDIARRFGFYEGEKS